MRNICCQNIIVCYSKIRVFLHAHHPVLVHRGRGLIGSRRRLLSVIAVMYLSTFFSWIALIVTQFETFSAINGGSSQSTGLLLLFDRGGTIALTLNVQSYFDYITPHLTHSNILCIQIVLGDGIVWWRVWVLWNKNSWILVSCCIIIFATVGPLCSISRLLQLIAIIRVCSL